MQKRLWACSFLLVCLLAGCSGNTTGESSADPKPKTEVIKQPGGGSEVKTSLPDSVGNK
jgi:hypothetical protein